MFGRDAGDWDKLTGVGAEFLKERAHLQRMTTYTELNATLVARTGIHPFDFELENERAAMGHLLGLIVDHNLAEMPAALPLDKRFLISALVEYLNENDAGPGFYALAKDKQMLRRNASRTEMWEFWLRQVELAFEYYS